MASRKMLIVVCTLVFLPGCALVRSKDGTDRIANKALGSLTVAVAPAINLSGTPDFDRDRFADAMAIELDLVDGVAVIPVSRVLATMAVEGVDVIGSPEMALRIARSVGADAILVFAVTEYDPYVPPRIGITAQLYGSTPDARRRLVDTVALTRQTTLGHSEAASREPLLGQVQNVFDASRDEIDAGIRRFAEYRQSDFSPHGWRKHVVSQQHFIRYCCYETLIQLFRVQEGPKSS